MSLGVSSSSSSSSRSIVSTKSEYRENQRLRISDLPKTVLTLIGGYLPSYAFSVFRRIGKAVAVVTFAEMVEYNPTRKFSFIDLQQYSEERLLTSLPNPKYLCVLVRNLYGVATHRGCAMTAVPCDFSTWPEPATGTRNPRSFGHLLGSLGTKDSVDFGPLPKTAEEGYVLVEEQRSVLISFFSNLASRCRAPTLTVAPDISADILENNETYKTHRTWMREYENSMAWFSLKILFTLNHGGAFYFQAMLDQLRLNGPRAAEYIRCPANFVSEDINIQDCTKIIRRNLHTVQLYREFNLALIQNELGDCVIKAGYEQSGALFAGSNLHSIDSAILREQTKNSKANEMLSLLKNGYHAKYARLYESKLKKLPSDSLTLREHINLYFDAVSDFGSERIELAENMSMNENLFGEDSEDDEVMGA